MLQQNFTLKIIDDEKNSILIPDLRHPSGGIDMVQKSHFFICFQSEVANGYIETFCSK